MNFLWLTMLVCLSACAVQSQEMTQEVAKRGRGRRLCGYHLAQTLAVVCEGSYNLQFGKRNGDDNDLQEEDYDYEQLQLPSSPLAWPLLSRQSANSLLQRDDYHRRFRRQTGVVDECCYKICDIYTLMSYCAKKKA